MHDLVSLALLRHSSEANNISEKDGHALVEAGNMMPKRCQSPEGFGADHRGVFLALGCNELARYLLWKDRVNEGLVVFFLLQERLLSLLCQECDDLLVQKRSSVPLVHEEADDNNGKSNSEVVLAAFFIACTLAAVLCHCLRDRVHDLRGRESLSVGLKNHGHDDVKNNKPEGDDLKSQRNLWVDH